MRKLVICLGAALTASILVQAAPAQAAPHVEIGIGSGYYDNVPNWRPGFVPYYGTFLFCDYNKYPVRVCKYGKNGKRRCRVKGWRVKRYCY